MRLERGDPYALVAEGEPAGHQALHEVGHAAGGQVAEVIPHLTIGDDPSRAKLEAAEAEVRPYLPIEAEATSVALMTGPPPGSAPTAARWTTVATFSLA